MTTQASATCRNHCTACWLADHKGHETSVRSDEKQFTARCWEEECDGAFLMIVNVAARTDLAEFDALTHQLTSAGLG